MILYCDTSALIKRYVEENGTEYVDALWDDCWGVATSVEAFAEAMSAFGRKLREVCCPGKSIVQQQKKSKMIMNI